MSSFAKAQLLKYGWTEGKGLGKNENGMVEAIRPKLKFDTKGIGHSDKEHKWWESVYDKASSVIKIESREIAVGIEDADAVRITAKKIRPSKLAESLRYGNFLKTCTLDEGKIVAEEGSGGSESRDSRFDGAAMELTDEQLFRVCGGRTAHKGARHGLKLNGKLARIARQEAQLLGNLTGEAASGERSEAETKRAKRKRKRSRSGSEIDEIIKVADVEAFSPPIVESDAEAQPKKSKKSRRKEKRRFQELASKLNDFSIIEVESRSKMAAAGKKKRSKQSNVRSEVGREIPFVDLEADSDGLEGPRKKKNLLSEAERLNYRIDKKKKKASAKRVDKMSDCLMAVNLNEDSGDSGNPTSPVRAGTKKMKKRRKKQKGERSRDIISMIELEG